MPSAPSNNYKSQYYQIYRSRFDGNQSYLSQIKTMRILLKLVVSLFLAILISQIAWAKDAALKKTPVEIISDTLKYYPQKKIAVFEGKVEGSQGEMKINCEKMVLHMKSTPGDSQTPADVKESNMLGSSKISRIELEGNVVIITEKDRAEADRGEYVVDSGMVYLYDNVKLQQGDNLVYGDKLDYNRNTGESLVTSSNKSKRVRGHFTPNDKSSSK
jgi:lipopolysaccharide export system protein LptA